MSILQFSYGSKCHMVLNAFRNRNHHSSCLILLQTGMCILFTNKRTCIYSLDLCLLGHATLVSRQCFCSSNLSQFIKMQITEKKSGRNIGLFFEDEN